MRTCAFPGCEAGLEHLRADAKFCSSSHSREYRRLRDWERMCAPFYAGLRLIRRRRPALRI